MRRISVLPVLALACVLFAEDPPKDAFVVPHDWHGFKDGSWVEIRTKGTSKATSSKWDETQRWTLKETKDGVATLEIATMKDGQPTKPTATGAFDSPVRESAVTRAGEKELKVGARTFQCVVWEVRLAKPQSDSEGMSFWVCPGAPVPGGVVRYETHRDDSSYAVSEIRTLVDVDREVDVCGRKVKCAVWKEIHSRDGEITIIEIEDLRSAAVPGGLVRQTARRRTEGREGTADETVDVTQEVTAVHLEGDSWAGEKK